MSVLNIATLQLDAQFTIYLSFPVIAIGTLNVGVGTGLAGAPFSLSTVMLCMCIFMLLYIHVSLDKTPAL